MSKGDEQHQSEHDAHAICDSVGELGISVDEAALRDLDQATTHQHDDHHEQRAHSEPAGATPARPPDDRKQDGERVDEVREEMLLAIGTMSGGLGPRSTRA